jgi:hypothetical protein
MKPAGGSRRETRHSMRRNLNQAPVVQDSLIVQMPDALCGARSPSLFAQEIASDGS